MSYSNFVHINTILQTEFTLDSILAGSIYIHFMLSKQNVLKRRFAYVSKLAHIAVNILAIKYV